ncbi:hypothetical protein SAM23877_2563 [Streptomyces ambofaciens ATCC 23877]|uniref:Uncharacterized protein n=1 Tax=Streptomyces ambofaciens (strain ATCC 23877 / 3486 / DSM 40053 / JCM 4204 / NBRC 12836 / NRRL B-2516) TaxID=278992 RepID=A0A0K2AS28_STRA7|nr:hypothetical protein SAM23877_2563 [Streptomyces ambofaciens ATCC 23877]
MGFTGGGLVMANGSRQAAWEFFGAELKRRREDAGITQVELRPVRTGNSQATAGCGPAD